MKKFTSLETVYRSLYEDNNEESGIDHVKIMTNVASELADIAQRIKDGTIKPDDGDRLMDLAKTIEEEYSSNIAL